MLGDARDPLKDPVEFAGVASCFEGLMARVLRTHLHLAWLTGGHSA